MKNLTGFRLKVVFLTNSIAFVDISIAVILVVGNFFESSIAIQPEPVPRSKILFLSFNFETT